MINENIPYFPAYTTREVRNLNLFKSNSLYKFMFTRTDNLLLDSGAVKLIPLQMCKVFVSSGINLSGKVYKAGDIIDCSKFDFNTIRVLVKTGVLKCELKDEFKDLEDKDLIQNAILYNYVGKPFKDIIKDLNLDKNIVKETFNFQQGYLNKKITEKDLEKIKRIYLVKTEV